ncbi:MAG TPA: hypothetical protein GXZ69_01635 [Spirochaetales bacterium]|nr:hypothetical protein [Spirochaetales bacterium]
MKQIPSILLQMQAEQEQPSQEISQQAVFNSYKPPNIQMKVANRLLIQRYDEKEVCQYEGVNIDK